MKKQINKKPVASFDYETGKFSSGTDIGKLRALIFNQKPEYHNEMLDLIKSRMTAKEVLQLIDHMDRNPSQVRLFQIFSVLLGPQFDADLLINLVNKYVMSLIDCNNEILKQWLQTAEKLNEREELSIEQLVEKTGERIVADADNLETGHTITAKDINDHYNAVWNRESDEITQRSIKTTYAINSGRLLLELCEKFKQGTPIDNFESIYLTESKQLEKDIINYKAKIQESSLRIREMMRDPVNGWDFYKSNGEKSE